ncbi:MAG: type II toxin-antitoxin system CcdA family antitoxin [Phenylobacterium sp.]
MGKAELKVEIDAALLDEARAAGVDLAGVTEAAVRSALRSQSDEAAADLRAAKWAEENADAIADYNRRIADRGLIGAQFRKW